jgi:hypothetical protein
MDVVKNNTLSATVAIDALRPSDNAESVNVGAELGWFDILYLRAGYKSLIAREGAFNKDTQQDGPAFGAGIHYRVEGVAAFQVDYAWMKFGLFGDLSTISLSVAL